VSVFAFSQSSVRLLIQLLLFVGFCQATISSLWRQLRR